MTRRYQLLLSLFLITTFIISCDKKDDPIPEPESEPFPSLSTYTDRFLSEAKSRGYELDLSTLDVSYVNEEIVEAGKIYCGYGYTIHPMTGRRTVLISKANTCGWATDTDLQREQFVFHEIGHAFLNLTHDNSLLCDGTPASLMHQDARKYSYYSEKPETKQYYLDELFDRLAAEEKCIDALQNWATNPTYYKHQGGDELWTFNNSQGNMVGSRLTEASPYSLVISSIPEKTSSETGYWFTQLSAPNIPRDAKVTLRTKVNSTGLTGPGVSIALRVYETQILSTGAQTIQSFVGSTENEPATGILTNHVLEVSIPNFTRKSTILIPFAVMLPGTEGEVHFDDFEIIVEE